MKNYQNYSMDDIIFEGRNQQYGAYQLRQSIDRHSTIGLLVTITIFTFLLIICNIHYWSNAGPETIPTIVKITPVDIQLRDIDLPKPKVEPTTSPPPANTIKNNMINVVQNTVEPAPEKQQDQVKYQASDVTKINPEITSPSTPAIVESTSPSSTGGTIIDVQKTVVSNKIIDHAELMPSYEGGNAALIEYLKTHIRPFESDIQNELAGKVYIKFYVDTDGTVRNPEVIKDNVGGRCAEAAISAIKKMPKWKPGMQNGSPVKVHFTLPVSFDFSH